MDLAFSGKVDHTGKKECIHLSVNVMGVGYKSKALLSSVKKTGIFFLRSRHLLSTLETSITKILGMDKGL